MTPTDFRSIVAGKRIALVGGLPVWAGYLAQYDFIVACQNYPMPFQPRLRYFRGKTYEDKTNLRNNLCSYVLNPLNPSLREDFSNRSDILWLPMCSYNKTNPFDPSFECVNILYKKLKTIPLLGFIAMTHLLHNDPTEIHLCGMDLYADLPGALEPNYTVNGHDIAAHISYLSELLECDKRITLDLKMKKRLGRLFK